MDLNEIAVFTKVVDTGSFTAAATALGVPKSTVSRRVSQLEERLGVRLMHRTTRRLTLTDVGQAFYARCVRAVAELEEAEDAVVAAQDTPTGTLRVTAPVEFAYLAALGAEYLAQYPNTQLDLVLTGRLVDLVDEGFDLAIRATTRLADSTLVARKLGSTCVRLSAAPSYLARRSAPTTLAELSEHECLLFGEPTARRRATWQLTGPETGAVTVTGRLITNSITALHEAALAGVGIAALPMDVARASYESGRLVAVLPDYRLPPAGVFAVYPSTRHLSANVRAFIDFLLERLPPYLDPQL